MAVLPFFVCCCSGGVGFSSREARQALNAAMALDGSGETSESDSLAGWLMTIIRNLAARMTR